MGLASDLLDLEIPAGPKISPDGKRIVYSAKQKWTDSEQPQSSIWIAEARMAGSARRVTTGFQDRMPQWSPDSSTIAFVSDRGNRGKSCAIFQWPLESGAIKPLTPATDEREISKFQYSPSGKHIAFVSSEKSSDSEVVVVWGQHWKNATLHLLDIDSGHIRLVSNPQTHIVDFSWNEDGSEIAIVTKPSPHIESEVLGGVKIATINVTRHDYRLLCHIPWGATSPVWIGGTLYFIASSTLSEEIASQAVYSVPTTGQGASASPEKLAHGEDDCAFSLAKHGKDVVVYAQKGMEDQLRLLRGPCLFSRKKSIDEFDVALDGQGETLLTIVQGSINHPQELFSVTTTGSMIRLSDHGFAFADQSFGRCEFVECDSLDGLERIQGMFLSTNKPSRSGQPGLPGPTVVLIHGGPYYRVTDSFNFLDHFFMPRILAEGFNILVPNYRGSCGRGERFSSYSRGGVGIYDEPDIVAMTQHAIERGLADKDRLLVAGKSQGGFLSYLSSVRNGLHGLGWRFRGAIPFAGVSDWDTLSMTSDIGYEQTGLAGGAPWDLDKSDTRTRAGSAIWEFGKAAKEKRIPPMLLLHGAKDVRVPISQADGFRRALDQAGLPFEMAVYPNEQHMFKGRKSVEDVMERVVRFLHRYLEPAVEVV